MKFGFGFNEHYGAPAMSQTLAGPCFLKPLEEQVSTAFPQLSLRGSAFACSYPEPE